MYFLCRVLSALTCGNVYDAVHFLHEYRTLHESPPPIYFKLKTLVLYHLYELQPHQHVLKSLIQTLSLCASFTILLSDKVFLLYCAQTNLAASSINVAVQLYTALLNGSVNVSLMRLVAFRTASALCEIEMYEDALIYLHQILCKPPIGYSEGEIMFLISAVYIRLGSEHKEKSISASRSALRTLKHEGKIKTSNVTKGLQVFIVRFADKLIRSGEHIFACIVFKLSFPAPNPNATCKHEFHLKQYVLYCDSARLCGNEKTVYLNLSELYDKFPWSHAVRKRILHFNISEVSAKLQYCRGKVIMLQSFYRKRRCVQKRKTLFYKQFVHRSSTCDATINIARFLNDQAVHFHVPLREITITCDKIRREENNLNFGTLISSRILLVVLCIYVSQTQLHLIYSKRRKDNRNRAIVHIQRHFRGYKGRVVAKGRRIITSSAFRIQTNFRRYQNRKRFREHIIRNRSASCIQCATRKYLAKLRTQISQYKSAILIQKMYRSYMVCSEFPFFKSCRIYDKPSCIYKSLTNCFNTSIFPFDSSYDIEIGQSSVSGMFVRHKNSNLLNFNKHRSKYIQVQDSSLLNVDINALFLIDYDLSNIAAHNIIKTLQNNNDINELGFGNCTLSSGALRVICEYLRCQNFKIEKLFYYNMNICDNPLCSSVLGTVSDFFFARYSNLKVLELGCTGIQDGSCFLLQQCLLFTSTLKFLGLSGNSISCKGCILLCSGLEENSTLAEINLSANFIGYAGACNLGKVIKKPGNRLEKIRLCYNAVTSPGGKVLLKCAQTSVSPPFMCLCGNLVNKAIVKRILNVRGT